MASEQLIKKTQHHAESGDAPQVTHFESLTVKNSGDQPAVVHRVVDTMHGATSGIHDQTSVQQRKNNFGGSQSMEKNSKQITGKQTINQQAGANNKTTRETIGLTDVGKKGASYVGEKAMETGEYVRQAAGTATDVAAKAASVTASGAADFATGVAESVGNIAGTVKEVGKKGVGYIGETAVTGKDITLDTGKKAAGYVGKGVYATDEGVRESMESINAGVAKAVEGTAVAAESVTGKAMEITGTAVEAGKKGASFVGDVVGKGKDVTLEIGKTTVHNVGKGARVAEESVREGMESLNAGVARAVEDTAVVAESVTEKAMGLTGTAVEAGKKGTSYIGETIGKGKDVTFEIGKTTARNVGTAAGAVKDATLVGGWTAAELASGAVTGVTESMESLNEGVAGILESTTLATEDVAQKALNTIVDVGKKGASYIGEKVVAGKDITLETGKATSEYVGKGASVVKDATLVGGWSALELASDTTKGVTESMENVNEGVAGLVENAASVTEGAVGEVAGLKDVAVDACKRGASYVGEKGVVGKDIAFEYAGKVVDVVKDASLVTGWSAAEVASGTTGGVTESIEDLNAGVAGLVEGTALATEDVAQKTIGTMADMGKKGASYVGGKTRETLAAAGRGATEFGSESGEESKENLTTTPKNVVVEREEVTIDYGKNKKT